MYKCAVGGSGPVNYLGLREVKILLRGLYTAATGMLVNMHRMDTVANNLANVSTAGYRLDRTVQRAFPQYLIEREEPLVSGERGKLRAFIGRLGTGVTVDGSYTDFTVGPLRPTGNPLDVALLEPEGMFTVQTEQGRRYTRNGSFRVNSAGQLVTGKGDPVLGSKGPIHIDGTRVVIDSKGRVLVDDVFVDKLLITAFTQPQYLRKEAGQYFVAPPEAGAQEMTDVTVSQGQLEMSNVNTVMEMVKMINIQRAYEANQRMARAQDDTLGKLVNELGKA